MAGSHDDALAQTGLQETRPEEAPRLTGGATLGRYVIKDVLGSGGMGVVYRAQDPELGRVIALKVVRPGETSIASSQSGGRLVREAQAMARVAHPNVIVVHDAGTVGAQVFVAMELVDGEDLATWEQSKPRDWREVHEVYKQAAKGLAAAHDAGLVHRDFKPANALIARDGRVRVLDFGLARTLDEQPPADSLAATAPPSSPPGGAALTQTGAVMGTPQFMSPEQHRGERADARSDQFSFCVALYHALYGSYPFKGNSYAELAVAVTEGDPIAPPRKGDIPAAFGKVVLRGLQRAPDGRFASMNELVAALDAAIPRRRWPLYAGAGVLLAAAAAVVAAVLLRPHTRGDAPIAMAFGKNQQPITYAGTQVATPALTPDGKHLAYVTAKSIIIRDLSTGDRVEVPELNEVWDVRWSPRGDRLLTSTGLGIVIRNLAGAEVQRVPIAVGADCRMTWSPDELEVLSHCTSEPDLTIVTLATAKTRSLSVHLADTDRVVALDWGRPGILLGTYGSKGGALYVAQLDGTTKQLATDQSVGAVRWNVRGTRVYYSRGTDTGFEIVYRDATRPSAPAVVVLEQPQGQFSFAETFSVASDERVLVFAQWKLTQDVVRAPLPYTGEEPRALTADGAIKVGLAVSRDESMAAYASGAWGKMRVYKLPLAGGAPVELGAEAGDYRLTSFSPDGAQLAVLSIREDHTRLLVMPTGGGPAREVATPEIGIDRLTWLANGQIAVIAIGGGNVLLVDPVANTAKTMWPKDSTDDVSWFAFSDDATRFAANIPHDQASSLAQIDVASGEEKVLAPTAGMQPFGWSSDDAWVFGIDTPTDDARLRIVAQSASGDGSSRLVGVLPRGLSPTVLAHETGVVWIRETNVMDLWLASVDQRPALARGKPAPPPAPPTSPPLLAAPQNLALAGAPGGLPTSWEGTGEPTPPKITSSCGRPGTCVELDGASNAAIAQHIDATAYRGHRIKVTVDLEVRATTCILVVDSGIYAASEVPSGQLRVREQGWEKRVMYADVAPDAIYIELKVLVQHAGTARIGSLTVEPVAPAAALRKPQ